MIEIISAGLAPGIALLSYFYLKDQYDNEPVHMVIRSFMLGVILVFQPCLFSMSSKRKISPRILS